MGIKNKGLRHARQQKFSQSLTIIYIMGKCKPSAARIQMMIHDMGKSRETPPCTSDLRDTLLTRLFSLLFHLCNLLNYYYSVRQTGLNGGKRNKFEHKSDIIVDFRFFIEFS